MITGITRMSSFLRTFLLQAGWNYDRMQHVGVAYAMLPALRRIYPARESLAAAAGRHLEYFNTHPYLAPAVLGAALQLEEEVAAGRRRPDEVASFKNGIMGSYGAIGDSFFWAALRPFGGVTALALVLLGAGALGPMAFVLGFDVMALWIRGYGFFAGLALGPLVVTRLARLDFAGSTRRLKMASAAVAGLAAALWAAKVSVPAFEVSGSGIPVEAAAFPLVVLLAGMARRGFPPALAALGLAALAGGWHRFGGAG